MALFHYLETWRPVKSGTVIVSINRKILVYTDAYGRGHVNWSERYYKKICTGFEFEVLMPQPGIGNMSGSMP